VDLAWDGVDGVWQWLVLTMLSAADMIRCAIRTKSVLEKLRNSVTIQGVAILIKLSEIKWRE
jgi:hypothetical protein